MTQHIAEIHNETRSEFGVSFPDSPGFLSAGSTLEQARPCAENALELRIEGMLEDGEALRPPSRLDTAACRPSFKNSAAIFALVEQIRKKKT